MDMQIWRHCLCGAVTPNVEAERSGFHDCHCGMCRSWHGGTAIASEVARRVLEGEASVERFRSSDWAERGFRTGCGSTLFYRILATGRCVVVAGSFAGLERLPLDGEIFIDDKPDGHAFAGDHPRLTGAEAFAGFAEGEPPPGAGGGPA